MVVKKTQVKKTKEVAPTYKRQNMLISEDENEYVFAVGRSMASGFAGFIAGMLVSALVWVVIINAFYTV